MSQLQKRLPVLAVSQGLHQRGVDQLVGVLFLQENAEGAAATQEPRIACLV